MHVKFDDVEVKETDMDPDLMAESIEIAKEAQKRYVEDKDIAAYIKDTFEQKFGPTWHCVVGRSFGSRVSYETQHFILLKIKYVSVMVFKCG
uniref:Dynein light chain n=1 Tax=Acrobeloides nanus TaxID=290746 RepID=A0A914E774_9BILA